MRIIPLLLVTIFTKTTNNKIRRNDMNDLLNDIKKLENLKNLLWEKDISSKDFSRNKISTHIQEMIKEKLDIVSDFEKQNMSYENYAKHMEGVGLDDVA